MESYSGAQYSLRYHAESIPRRGRSDKSGKLGRQEICLLSPGVIDNIITHNPAHSLVSSKPRAQVVLVDKPCPKLVSPHIGGLQMAWRGGEDYSEGGY
jgi:hypothetical protein